MRVWECVVGRPAAKTMVVGEVETSASNKKVVHRSNPHGAVRRAGRVMAGGQGRIR